VVILLVLALSTRCAFFSGDQKQVRGTISPSPTVSHPVPLTAAAARALEVQVRSGDVTAVSKAFIVPDAKSMDASFVRNLASLKQFRVDETRFTQAADAAATVPVTTVDGAGTPTRWTATLVLVEGAWRIAATQAAAP
jgi:hypothetical protein